MDRDKPKPLSKAELPGPCIVFVVVVNNSLNEIFTFEKFTFHKIHPFKV